MPLTASLRRALYLVSLAMLLHAPALQAQAFPSKPIRIVVPFPAGGGSDIVARKLAEHLRDELGQAVIVDNKAGASGNIGADAVARSAPDGYTVMVTAAPFAIAPAMFKSLSFDPVKDFTPIAQLATVPLLIVTRTESPLNSVADILAQARREPDRLSYATFGNGSPPHLVGESMKLMTGTRMTHVPYKGGQVALPDILSGQISFAIMDVVSMAPLVKSGRLKALAITGAKRSPAMPEVPTLSQSGVAFDTVGWHAMFGPAGMPASVVDKLNAAVTKAMATADMRGLIVNGGSIPIEPASTAEQWTRQFRDDVRVWGKVAKDSGATID
jgi:tripartite-type tricarboxylate transporter receptor subunit TctC